MEGFKTAVLIVLGIGVFLFIIYLINRFTSLLLPRCKLCKKKRRYFYYAYETNAPWRDEGGGEPAGHYIEGKVFKSMDNLCTHCTYEHKLFDNYG